MKLLAVLPQPPDEARKYLDGEGVNVDDVRQMPLQAIGVLGTPTLLLVDARGTVADVWRGKLQPEGENKGGTCSGCLPPGATCDPNNPGQCCSYSCNNATLTCD